MSKKNRYYNKKSKKKAKKSAEKQEVTTLTNVDITSNNTEKVVDYLLDDLESELSIAQIDFVNEYLKNGNATQAYKNTLFKVKNVSENSVRELASKELKKPAILSYMRKIKKAHTISKFDYKISPAKFVENTLIDLILDLDTEEQSRMQAIKEYARLVKDNVIIDTKNILEFTPSDFSSDLNIEIHNKILGVTDEDSKFENIKQIIEDNRKKEIVDNFDFNKLSIEELEEIKKRIDSK